MGERGFRLLGPLEVTGADGPLAVGPGRARALLALLLLHRNEVLPVERLLEELWQGEPPATAAHALQVYVSNLRRLLEPDRERGATAFVLVTQRPGYLLAVPPEDCDADRFETMVADGVAALDDGRAADASRILREALALWRGPVLADLIDEPFVQAEATRLDELRLVATERCLDAELALGRHDRLASELDGLVRRHPYRERLWAQLILALYRSGRQADALRAYQRLRDVLGDELGLEPSPELRQLESAVLRHDPSLDLSAAAEPVPAPAPPASVDGPPGGARAEDDSGLEEMRAVTAVFADLVGSTPLAEQLPPEELSLVVNGVVDRMTAAAESLGGTIASRMGEGILALFGADQAHEDDPERAVRAGLRIVAEVETYGQEVAQAWEVAPLRARVGIDTGAVLVNPAGDQQVLGDPLNTAARLQAAAAPGSVLVSGAVQRLVRPLFDWGPTEAFELKGKAGAVAAAEAIGARPDTTKVRGLEGHQIPVIGREAEMAAAAKLVDAVLAGTGGVLLVTGEAGTGKSRLQRELRERLEGSESVAGGPLWLEGRCLSWGGPLAYWPFRELIRAWLGASPTQPALRTRVTLRLQLDELFGAEASELSAYLAGVLGLPLQPDEHERVSAQPSEALRQATFGAVRRLLGRLAEDRPVVVALDDLHWGDVTSLQLIEHVLPIVETSAVLFVLAQRSERDHRSWQVRETALREFGHRSQEVTLQPLGGGNDARMLDELLGAGTLPSATTRELLAAAEGNPLFIEELVRSLIDGGALRHGPDGWSFEPGAAVAIPGSIEAVLASRIDRLAGRTRGVLSAAAALGRQFDVELLMAVCDEGTDIDLALGELQRLNLLVQARRWPALEYRFHHALIQEAAYRRLVVDRRRELHQRAASAIETRFQDRLAESYGVLAYHYERAGEAEPALTYHRLAGDAARVAYALDEAARHYTAAVDLLPAVPAERAGRECPAVHFGRGYAWWQLADRRAGDELRRALAAARAGADETSELAVLEILSATGMVEGGVDLGSLEEGLALARRVADHRAEVALQNRLTVALANQLKLAAALASGEAALATARRSADELLIARAMDGLKLVAFVLGDYPALRRIVTDVEEVLRRHDQRWYLQFVLAEGSFASAATGDWDAAVRQLDEAQAINEALDTPYLLTLRAWLERERGHYQAAVDLARTAAVAANADGNILWMAWTEAHLGAILVEIGAFAEAIPHLDTGRAAAEQGETWVQLVRLVAHQAVARRECGDEIGAQRDLERAQNLLSGIDPPPGKQFLYGLDAYLAVADMHIAAGATGTAIEVVAPLLPAAEAAGWAEGVARTTLLLGECARQRGETERAAAFFRRALAAATGAGLAPVVWQAHAGLASQEQGPPAADHARLARTVADGLAAAITEPALRRAFFSRMAVVLPYVTGC
jgi:DNA-binding SARP family transcriptional activator/class 3 adenylate cyclase